MPYDKDYLKVRLYHELTNTSKSIRIKLRLYTDITCFYVLIILVSTTDFIALHAQLEHIESLVSVS